jgi:hypothetical protein
VAQVLAHFQAQHGVVVEQLHGIQPLVDRVHIQQRLVEPAAQQPPAHRGARVVEHAEQTAVGVAAAHGFGQFQVAPRRFVQRHELAAAVAVQPGEQAERAGLHRLHIGQDGACRAHRVPAPLQPETVQAAHAKVAFEAGAGGVRLHLPRLNAGGHRAQRLHQTVDA